MSKKIKCETSCLQKEEDKCNLPFCKYINKSRKYCTLNRKLFTLRKENCQIYPKTKYIKTKYTKINKTKNNKTKKIIQYSVKNKDNLLSTRRKEILSALRKKRATRKIKIFMEKPSIREKITARFLTNICSDSGVCIVFGKESNKIKGFFDNFVDFKYLTGDIKKIGEVSQNGFIYELMYTRQKYNAYAILKSSVNPSNDNLMYEYFVGQAVNTFNISLPCFIETYGLFKYKTIGDWSVLMQKSISLQEKTEVVKNNLTFINNPNPTDLVYGCSDPVLQCLLIQHIKDTKSLSRWISELGPKFIENELFEILYIIYFSLTALSDKFTHYDLHAQNVLLYVPIKDKYINYVFHEDTNKTISFKSKFIPKIIDYGRCFYDIGPNNNSNIIYSELCKIKECKPECGRDYGFNWLNNKEYHINSRKRNISHDLRLIQYINIAYIKKFPHTSVSDTVKNFFKKISDYGNDYISKGFGTKENLTSGIPNNKINNVIDAMKVLETIVLDNLNTNNIIYQPFTSLGELHVYMDGRPMKFIKA